MQPNSLEYNVPSFASQEVYDFEINKDTLNIYKELSAIAEEIEKCRVRNL